MSGPTKKNVLGILVDALDYSSVVAQIVDAAKEKRPLSVTALAVHGLMSAYFNPELKYRINHLDLVVPDGQPVRWALNLLHGTNLRDRVYGPNLTLQVCGEAARLGLPVYLYGATDEISEKLSARLRDRFPGLQIAGAVPSRFRRLSVTEKDELCATIVSSAAAIVFVGIGCPKQEVWAYELRDELRVPIVSVGAAFAFHAGVLRQAPATLQKRGLEWLFRLALEPRRLWRRYFFLNPLYLILLSMQALGVRFETAGHYPTQELRFG